MPCTHHPATTVINILQCYFLYLSTFFLNYFKTIATYHKFFRTHSLQVVTFHNTLPFLLLIIPTMLSNDQPIFNLPMYKACLFIVSLNWNLNKYHVLHLLNAYIHFFFSLVISASPFPIAIYLLKTKVDLEEFFTI